MNIQIQENIPLSIFIEPAKRNIRKNYQSTYDNQPLTSSKYLHESNWSSSHNESIPLPPLPNSQEEDKQEILQI